MQNNIATMSGDEFGRTLTGFGVNLLVRNVLKTCKFLEQIMLFETIRKSEDFAILRHQNTLIQLHGDHTYHSNPLPSLLPENGARGAGVELRFYDIDPDDAEARAIAAKTTILQSCEDKPHGLRECYLLDPDGYCWIPSKSSKKS